MLKNSSGNDLLESVRINSLQLMATKAENLLNPCRYHLSGEAKKKLKWLYLLYYECGGNASKASNKIGISRQWLSTVKNNFERSQRDPRELEPESRAPLNASKRKRISKEMEERIIEIRDCYPCWGKEKISVILKRDYSLQAHPSTVNRYLRKHFRIDPKISVKNKRAWRNKKQKEINLKIKYRPPVKIKDWLPGALVEKDMKLTLKTKQFNPLANRRYCLKDYFYYQHTFIDSFTRIRFLELVEDSSSRTAAKAYQKALKKMPFKIASLNTDNGAENEKDFSKKINQEEIIHFYSRPSTPTDNPRVERSHLTDDQEFYSQSDPSKTFKERREDVKEWEHTYNFIRPHQALGYLTPIEFHRLWKEDPDKSRQIVKKYRQRLKQQRKRLAQARRVKKKEQIENLMRFIDAKLNQKDGLETHKLELINCQLCSWT